MDGRPLFALLAHVRGGPILLAGELRRPGALADALSAILRAGWTGELVVIEGTTRRALFIRDASIVGAVTDALSERIGAVMIRSGVIDPEQLSEIVARLGPGRRFGELALDARLVSRDRLFEVVRRQAEEILAGAISVGDGAFVFTEGFEAASILAPCQLDAREALSAALAKLSIVEGAVARSPSAPVPAVAQPTAPVEPEKRSASTAIGIVVTALLVGTTAFLLARERVVRRATPPAIAPPSTTSVAPSSSESPSPVVASASAPQPPSTVGTVRTAGSGGHRVWIDGKLVGETPQSFEVTCGLHVIRVGSAGQPQMTDVPCGAQVEVAFR